MALAGVMRTSKDDNAMVRAAAQLLDRGWGRAPQEHKHGGAGGSDEIKILIRTIIAQKK